MPKFLTACRPSKFQSGGRRSDAVSEIDVLVAATSKAAECIGRNDLGALAPGRIADILIVAGDPLADIRILEKRDNLQLIMKQGKAFTNRMQSR